QFGFTQEHFLVIYPGEYARLGATDMLTDVFITFFQQNPTTNIRLVFACRIKNSQDALKKEEVMRRCKQAGVLKYIAFADTIQDMPALYNTSDVILFPVDNLHGKFDVPLVIIEAYACGKPVILSDLPQFQEFSNEKICVTIPKGSPSKLIESVAYLRDNKAHCEALGYEARLFVEQHFDLKNTARQYSQVYDALA
ncbi:MAG TPA: glycosyltransferase, partial [Patescibacteria group bacterium]|nr:glycosyltransferase [Patescibacteria group bacterium]